jgi:uncharacterized protein
MTPPNTPTPFSIMTKPNGPRCNIDCKYCYYLEKEKFYPSEKKFRMTPEVLETYIRATIASSVEAGMREVAFAWQGGEPTILGVPYFEEIIALQRRHQPEGVRITNAIQTNGILLDDRWGAFLKDNRFLVGISIDGPQKLHDRYRIDRAGRPTFASVMRGLEVLQRHGVEHNALTVVHRHTAARGKEVYRFLRGIGIEYMQFIPIVERTADGTTLGGAPQMDNPEPLAVTDWSVSPRAYGKFLCDVFDIWFAHDIGKVFVQYFDTQVGLWMGLPSSLCVYAEDCGNALAIEHNGDVYSCDHYVYPDYRLGNIMQTPLSDMVWSGRQVEFGHDKSASLTRQCRECQFRFACNGGCPKHRFLKSRHGEDGQNYFCESYTMFLTHAGPRLREMATLVRLGRPADEARTTHRRGR